ncbi:MAG: LacI family DNA-binding transcriptional regulator [Planctomycetota bacterium]
MDIARELGVSRTAVSFVLTNSPNAANISQDKRKRIIELAKAWNYQPNAVARSLREQRSGIVGVVFPDLSHSWAERVLVGMHEVLEPREYVPLISMSLWKPERERQEMRSLVGRQVDAIISISPNEANQDLYEEVVRSGTPLLFAGDALASEASYHRVLWDEGQAVRAAMAHLVERGRQRIALLTSSYQSLLRVEREQAYRQVVSQAELTVDDRLIVSPPPHQGVEAAVATLLARSGPKPDAILATTDALAIPALSYLDGRGVSVPGDIAVMGLGDLPTSSNSRIGLTTVEPPTTELGRRAAQLALDLSDDPPEQPVHDYIRSSRVIPRSTT